MTFIPVHCLFVTERNDCGLCNVCVYGMYIIVDKIMYICTSGKQDSQVMKAPLFSVLLPLL